MQPNPPVEPGATTETTAPPAGQTAPPLTQTGPPGLDPNAPVDVTSLPANVQQLIKNLRDEAARSRPNQQTAAAQAKAQEAETQLAKVMAALGRKPDGSPLDDPAAAAAALSERAEVAEATAWRNGVRLAIYQAAGPLGANADGLLDSLAFVDTLDDLVDADPTSAEFRTALEAKIRTALEANPTLRAGQGPVRMGVEHTGGSNTGQRTQGLGSAIANAYRRA